MQPNKALQPTPSRFALRGCADAPSAVGHQLSTVASSGWLSLTFGFSLRRRNILVARSPSPHLHEISGRTARDQQCFLRPIGASICHDRCINLSRSEKYIFANLRYLQKTASSFPFYSERSLYYETCARMAEVSFVWAVLAEQGAAANPYPLRSWGCADLLPAVDHQQPQIARSGWLSLTLGQ